MAWPRLVHREGLRLRPPRPSSPHVPRPGPRRPTLHILRLILFRSVNQTRRPEGCAAHSRSAGGIYCPCASRRLSWATRHGSEKQPKCTMTHVTFLPPWHHPGSRPGHQLGCRTGPRAAGPMRVCRQQTGPTSGSAATVLRPVGRSLPLRVSVSSVTKQRNGASRCTLSPHDGHTLELKSLPNRCTFRIICKANG